MLSCFQIELSLQRKLHRIYPSREHEIANKQGNADSPSRFENHWSETRNHSPRNIVKNAMEQIKYSICAPQSWSGQSFGAFPLTLNIDDTTPNQWKSLRAWKVLSPAFLLQTLKLRSIFSGFLSFQPPRGILQRNYNYEFKCIIKCKHKGCNNICQFIVINYLVYRVKIIRLACMQYVARNYHEFLARFWEKGIKNNEKKLLLNVASVKKMQCSVKA